MPKGHLAKPRFTSLATRRSAGFTLIELLVVIAVIVILAGVTLAAMGGVQQKAARDRTKAEISAIANALEAYRSQYSGYPAPDGSNIPYANLAPHLGSEKITVEGGVVKDPFGNPYIYQFPGTKNRATYDLYSTAGAGINEVHKHIGNW